jgi:hypothetical protein
MMSPLSCPSHLLQLIQSPITDIKRNRVKARFLALYLPSSFTIIPNMPPQRTPLGPISSNRQPRQHISPYWRGVLLQESRVQVVLLQKSQRTLTSTARLFDVLSAVKISLSSKPSSKQLAQRWAPKIQGAGSWGHRPRRRLWRTQREQGVPRVTIPSCLRTTTKYCGRNSSGNGKLVAR